MTIPEMASSISPSADEPPAKRQKISPPPSPSTSTSYNPTHLTAPEASANSRKLTRAVMSESGFQPERELQVGITQFVNTENLGFEGVFKHRYTDFCVNELAPDGTVLHLTEPPPPKREASSKADDAKVSDEPVRGELETHAAAPAKEINKEEQSSSGQPKLHVSTSTESMRTEASNVSSTATDSLPTLPPFTISSGDEKILEEFFGVKLKNDIIAMHDKILAKPSAKSSVFGAVFTEVIGDKMARGRIHEEIRRIFDGHFETSMTAEGTIQFTANPPSQARNNPRKQQSNTRTQTNTNQPKGKAGWNALGGEYLHCNLLKENRDTMEVVNIISRLLKCNSGDIAFAGTKDRRAVTVQRISIYRKTISEVERVNKGLRGVRLGNFKYEQLPLELGENDGNQFLITLRDCQFNTTSSQSSTSDVTLANDVVSKAVEHLKNHGFLNYYGLQRFGTFGIGTDEIGKKILQSDYKGAVLAILSFSEDSLIAAKAARKREFGTVTNDTISRDDQDRAFAINLYLESGDARGAVAILPPKFSGERAILRHFTKKFKQNDNVGALLSITRNLRLMYVHAYQSLIWNIVASERWARHKDKIIKGDLIIVKTRAEKAAAEQDEVDENGEVIVRPAVGDFAVSHDDIFERARPLSAEEAKSGQYSIFDIVLPTPGWDVQYPTNDIGDYYREVMGSVRGGGLDPTNMRRKTKDFSLSGSYRKLMAQVGRDISFEIKTYTDDLEQLVETDFDKLQRSDRVILEARKPVMGPPAPRNNYNSTRGRQGDKDLQNRSIMAPPPTPANAEVGINAWLSLPAKLAAEDKARAEADRLAKLNKPAVRPDEIKQPIIKQIFIEKSVDGERTGRRVTKFVGKDGKELSKEDRDVQIAKSTDTATADSTKVEVAASVDSAPASEKNAPGSDDDEEMGGVPLSVTVASSDQGSDGGVLLDPEAYSKKRDHAVSVSSADSSLHPPAREIDFQFVKPGDMVRKEYRGPDIDERNAHKFNVSPKTQSGRRTDFSDLGRPEEGPRVKTAVVIKFILGTSQYATMFLRELMKLDGVKDYKPGFSGGR